MLLNKKITNLVVLLIACFCVASFTCCTTPQQNNPIVMQEQEDLLSLINWETGASYMPNGIACNNEYGDEFSIKTYHGLISPFVTDTEQFAKEFNLVCGDAENINLRSVCWKEDELDAWDETNCDRVDYVDVICKKEGNIVGFVVVKITAEKIQSEQNYFIKFNSQIIKSTYFPKVDGKYQDVSKEQINEYIEEAKEV